MRTVPAAGGASTVITSGKGHYFEPAFSPSGSTIVYRRGAGGFLTDPVWSKDTGLYRVDVDGGPATRFRRSGQSPHFGAEEQRVYFRDRAGFKTVLASVLLDEREERTHYRSDLATEMRVSPDGRWLAWAERFNAYLVPFVAASKPIDLSTNVRTLPSTKLSKDTGYDLHWSGDWRACVLDAWPRALSPGAQRSLSLRGGGTGRVAAAARAGVDAWLSARGRST